VDPSEADLRICMIYGWVKVSPARGQAHVVRFVCFVCADPCVSIHGATPDRPSSPRSVPSAVLLTCVTDSLTGDRWICSQAPRHGVPDPGRLDRPGAVLGHCSVSPHPCRAAAGRGSRWWRSSTRLITGTRMSLESAECADPVTTGLGALGGESSGAREWAGGGGQCHRRKCGGQARVMW
jgi:hypothetical protein